MVDTLRCGMVDSLRCGMVDTLRCGMDDSLRCGMVATHRSALYSFLAPLWFQLVPFCLTFGIFDAEHLAPAARFCQYLVLKWSPPPTSIQRCRGCPDATMALAPKIQWRQSGLRTVSLELPKCGPSFLMHLGNTLAHFWHQFDSNENHNAIQNQQLAPKCEQKHKP